MLITKFGREYYKIEDARSLPPFFINIVSASDIWLFLSSNGALTAGRQNSGASVFPYETDDRLHLSTSTGPKTLIRLENGQIWEPFNTGYDNPYKILRNLYKSVMGDSVVFEEINEDFGLLFSYVWETSEKYGIIRTALLKNLSDKETYLEVLDGVENIIPYGIPSGLSATSSCLTDAYKVAERPNNGKLAVYYLTTTIGDTVEPIEVLRANTVWHIGKCDAYLLSSRQISEFANGKALENEERSEGRKCAFMTYKKINLEPNSSQNWLMVLDARLSQKEIVALSKKVNNSSELELEKELGDDIKKGIDELVKIVASADGLQKTNDALGCIRHYMNTLYNNMRGGVFLDGYRFEQELFADFLLMRNKELAKNRSDFLEKIKKAKTILEVQDMAYSDGDPDLIRLSLEFLPLTFSRRHGDPSRPWNHFNIRVKDDEGNRLYHYEGNWRDIFQNWEALGLSFPGYLASMVAKFLNASTADGFNPYRITQEGVDWETPNPNDPWAGIGYWGDHQIVYLNKLLEWLEAYSPDDLEKLTKNEIFSYAEVPYEILPYEDLIKDGKHTIRFNFERHAKILERAKLYGSDGKLMFKDSKIYLASFFEKILVSVLAKLSNLVIGGGVWMNTQRPEWNDANNAIVGNGLSMVTVYQLYRHLRRFKKLLEKTENAAYISSEVKKWFSEIDEALTKRADYTPRAYLDTVGASFSKYREKIYKDGFSGKEELAISQIIKFCETALETLKETINANKRPDGMYHSYNILTLTKDSLNISNMFLMLEGQSAALGSGILNSTEALELVQNMEKSDLLNKRLGQFFLYPVKRLNSFLERNIIPKEMAEKSAIIVSALKYKHEGFVLEDSDGQIRFHDSIQQSSDLEKRLKSFDADEKEASLIREIYEHVFEHKRFTGRSGVMYKYEGIGSIYWHQNSKFMLSLQEVFTDSVLSQETQKKESDALSLKEAYYRLQNGFGFRKTPIQWGAFPLEPYSHTPYGMPAQQPGMTGQVKEDILTRFAELGVIIKNGIISFNPALLRREEFLPEASSFKYINVNGQKSVLELSANSLAFTICQVPVIYTLGDKVSVKISERNLDDVKSDLSLGAKHSRELFNRSGLIQKIEVVFKNYIFY